MSEQVEGGDSELNEDAIVGEDEEQYALQGVDESSDAERERLHRQRHAHRPPTSEEMREHLRTHFFTRVGACTACLDVGISSQNRRKGSGEDIVRSPSPRWSLWTEKFACSRRTLSL